MAAGRRQWPRAGTTAASAVLACLLVVAAALPLAAATRASDEAKDYVVVFKRGFDASKIKALCSREAKATSGHLVGLCRQRFSVVLNGFVGRWVVL